MDKNIQALKNVANRLGDAVGVLARDNVRLKAEAVAMKHRENETRDAYNRLVGAFEDLARAHYGKDADAKLPELPRLKPIVEGPQQKFNAQQGGGAGPQGGFSHPGAPGPFGGQGGFPGGHPGMAGAGSADAFNKLSAFANQRGGAAPNGMRM